MDAMVKTEQRFLPALAEAIATWFPELNGRSLAVSEVSITKDNVPTLPLAMVAFIRSVAMPTTNSQVRTFDIDDTFVIDFWLEPARYKKANGTETPFWSYYDYEAIRDKLLTNIANWEAPGGERVAFRGLTLEAEPLAVTLTFTFIASFRWCASRTPAPDGIVSGIKFNLCAPNDVCVPDCLDDSSCNPCEEAPIGAVPPDVEEA
jgi:hypothetical protein